jgi:hypothetical protein
MIGERISVSKISLESAEAYIRAALKCCPNQVPMTLAGDLHRALECIKESRMTEEEVRNMK